MGGGIINWYTVSGLVQARSSWSLLIKSNSKGNMGPTEGRALFSIKRGVLALGKTGIIFLSVEPPWPVGGHCLFEGRYPLPNYRHCFFDAVHPSVSNKSASPRGLSPPGEYRSLCRVCIYYVKKGSLLSLRYSPSLSIPQLPEIFVFTDACL